MTLDDVVRGELLAFRKQPRGVTPAGLGNADALRSVLGSGDPIAAYNALKHCILVHEGDLPLLAAAYSLGLASKGLTHLDRLQDFGIDYGYDQRQARRYSDRGIRQLASFIAQQWTLEAAPSMRIKLAPGDATNEVILSTSRFYFIDMVEPRVEILTRRGRGLVELSWSERMDGLLSLGFGHAMLPQESDENRELTLLWRGELWPSFTLDLPYPARSTFFGARIQVSL